VKFKEHRCAAWRAGRKVNLGHDPRTRAEEQGTYEGPLWLLMAQIGDGLGSCGWLVRMASAMDALADAGTR
jgi:hypothetical protein